MAKITQAGAAKISISVVSHGQIVLIADLLADINQYCGDSALELILTLNLDEVLPFAPDSFSFPIKIIRNAQPLGFGANHNQACRKASGMFFCVLNPDIRFENNPFPPLMACLNSANVGVAAPMVVNPQGEIEDSARHFPSPLKILCKVFGKCKGSDYELHGQTIAPEWVGGMFMLFKSEIFKQVNGFDARYFLYYEDVDLCARLRLSGYEVLLCPQAKVVHHAQRSSHRNLKYLRLHLSSMARFFCSFVYWRLQYRKWAGK